MNSVSITFPKVQADRDVADNVSWIQPGPTGVEPSTNSYKQIAIGSPSALVWAESIDMSSFVVQDKTFFPRDVQISEPGIALCAPVASWNDAASLQVLDLISNIPLDPEVVCQELLDGSFFGFPSTSDDNQFLVFGRYMAFTASSTSSFTGLMQLAKTSTFGAGLPSAADKLYCLRIVMPGSVGNTSATATLKMFPTRYTIVGEAREESELARIYRLRQSYEQVQRIV